MGLLDWVLDQLGLDELITDARRDLADIGVQVPAAPPVPVPPGTRSTMDMVNGVLSDAHQVAGSPDLAEVEAIADRYASHAAALAPVVACEGMQQDVRGDQQEFQDHAAAREVEADAALTNQRAENLLIQGDH